MALILAIEPDRRQASQLTAMVRGRLRAELVLANSAERALAALGDRVPDLILTSALLSSKDEAELGDRLRALDGAAAHVQTLTIPVLGAPEPKAGGGRGVLSALLGDRPHAAAPDGCDPAVFAEQCAAYLERAAAERERQVAAIELDLSSLLDEAVVRQLSAAIETVSAAEPKRRTEPPAQRSQALPSSPQPARPKRRPRDKPIQDEWGFFDPETCGFAMLLAKLDEIADVASSLPAEDPSAGSPDVSR